MIPEVNIISGKASVATVNRAGGSEGCYELPSYSEGGLGSTTLSVKFQALKSIEIGLK